MTRVLHRREAVSTGECPRFPPGSDNVAERSERGIRLAVFATICIDLLGFAIVLPLLPRYGEYFHASRLTLGLLMAAFSAMQFVFAPVWGRVSDVIGRRPVLLFGLLSTAGCYALFGFASQLPPDQLWLGQSAVFWLFVARILGGIAGATIPTAQAVIADITPPERRAQGMALVGAAFGIGFTFGPLIGAAFVSSDPHAPPSAWPGIVAALLSVAAFVFAWVRLPETRPPTPQAGAHRSWLDWSMLNRALARPRLRNTLLATFVTVFAFAQFESTLALLTAALGLSERANFLVFGVIGLLLAIFQGAVIRPMLARYSEYTMARLGTTTLAVALLLLGAAAMSTSIWTVVATLPLVVFGFSAVTPSLQSLLSRAVSAHEQGETLGLGQSISALSRIAGPVAGIGLFDNVERFRPYWCAAGLMLVAIVLVSALRDDPDSVTDPVPPR